jgi:hypothetical protein
MSPTHHRVGTLLRKTFLGLPYLSLLVHLLVLHWVYKAHVYAADLSPVLLGIAVALGRVTTTQANRVRVAVLRAGLPAAAVMLSSDPPGSLRLAPFGAWGPDVTPLLLAVATAYLVYVHLFLVRYALLFLAGGFLAGLAYLFGPSSSQVAGGAKQGVDWVSDLIGRLVPKTTAGWGVTAVVAAFAFLGIGAAISLRKPPGDDERDAPPAPPPDAVPGPALDVGGVGDLLPGAP